MQAASLAGSERTYPYWVAAALLLAYLRPTAMPQLNVVTFAAGFVIAAILVPWFKALTDFPRPISTPGSLALAIPALGLHGESFPSGHATFAALMAAALGTGAPPMLRWTLWLFAAIVGLSRVAVGAHFPADVAGGFVVGLGVALGVRLVLLLARRLSRVLR